MKLIKKFFDGWNHFYLKNERGDTIGTTKFPFPPEMIILAKSKNIELSRLCHENCEAIEKGYDLKEIVKKHLKEWKYEQFLGGGSTTLVRDNFVMGFQKAIELMGDKRFNSRDMIFAFMAGTNAGAKFESMYDCDSEDNSEAYNLAEEAEKEFLESLKLKNEWDVYIETEPMNVDEIHEQGKGFLNKNISKSKLDLNGCLILKVKKDEQNKNN
jgi:hypothetical protein